MPSGDGIVIIHCPPLFRFQAYVDSVEIEFPIFMSFAGKVTIRMLA
jgi:hypothetical protein